jgi:hypothetical protein
MSANRIIIVVVAIALLVTAGLITQSVIATANTVSSVREPRAADADVARWVAEGEYYSKLQPVAASFDPQRSRDVDAARWAALGEAYSRLDDNRGRAADAARWVAMGEYYTGMSSVEAAKQAHNDLIAAARYTGMALEDYELTGKKSSLPACIPADVMAELPATIGDNHWKSMVSNCSQ